MLVVGDFNDTWGNSGFVALLHEGLTDGAAARGEATDNDVAERCRCAILGPN